MRASSSRCYVRASCVTFERDGKGAAPASSRADGYIRSMSRFLVAAAILVVLTGAMLLLSVAQNDGCLPWQERVGTPGDTFAEVEGNTRCR